MTVMRSAVRAALVGWLALPLLSTGTASAAWSRPSVIPTRNDGLELVGLSLSGQSMIHSMSVPFFSLNQVRYELKDELRVGELIQQSGEGVRSTSALYRVPVDGGIVEATLIYTMLDQAAPGSEEAQVSSWVSFNGPRGDYRFAWRMDVDPGARKDNTVLLEEKGQQTLVTLERQVELDASPVLIQERLGDDSARLILEPHATDKALLSVVQFHGKEADLDPASLVDGEAMTGAKGGGDTVLWYETRLNGVSSGLTGPDVYAVPMVRVSAVVEQDKMVGAEFVTNSVTVFGETRSFTGAFADAGINVTSIKNDDSSLTNDSSSTNSELHSLMVANKDFESLDSTSSWYSWVGTVLASSSGSGVLGIMFDDGATNTDSKPRQGCAVFYNPHKSGTWPDGDTYMAELLLTMTHESGHVYNQHHEDYCAGRFSFSTFRSDSAIMGYAFMDTSQWTFSKGSINTMTNEAEEYSRPGHGYAFTTGGAYNMTPEHEALHSATSCRRVCCLNQ